MDDLKDIAAYLISRMPAQSTSNARLTKMVYLADWRSVVRSGKQLTGIQWYFDSYGPFVWDVYQSIEENLETFEPDERRGRDGIRERVIRLRDKGFEPNLSDRCRETLDHVLLKTRNLGWKDFIRLVYSTFPIFHSEQFTDLDLAELGRRYKAQQTTD